MDVTIEIDFNYIKRLFASEEYLLVEGERVYFSKRLMLATIHNQLPIECQEVLIVKFPNLFKLLSETNMVKICLNNSKQEGERIGYSQSVHRSSGDL